MTKTGALRKRGLSWLGKPLKLRPGANVKEHDPSIRLRDPVFIRKAIFEALAQGDYEAVTEIYRAHLNTLNRSKGAKAMGVSRPYYHKLLRPSTEPSLPTFVKFMHLLKTEQSGRSSFLSI